MANPLLPNGPFYNASSAQINVNMIGAIVSNIINSSALSASSGVVIQSQLNQASSCILGLATQNQSGYQVSS